MNRNKGKREEWKEWKEHKERWVKNKNGGCDGEKGRMNGKEALIKIVSSKKAGSDKMRKMRGI